MESINFFIIQNCVEKGQNYLDKDCKCLDEDCERGGEGWGA